MGHSARLLVENDLFAVADEDVYIYIYHGGRGLFVVI